MRGRGIDPDQVTPLQVAWAKFTMIFEKHTMRAGAEEALALTLAEVERRDPEMGAAYEARLGDVGGLKVIERSAVDRLADLSE